MQCIVYFNILCILLSFFDHQMQTVILFIHFVDSISEKCVNDLLPGSLDSWYCYFQYIKKRKTILIIGNHLKEQHDMEPEDIAQSFRILRKCQNKFDCLIFEMFFIQELKPTLNKQCDSIRAKLFV